MTANNVVPLNPDNRAPEKPWSSENRWGKKVMDSGFCVVPSLLLRG